jgi:vacuolar-type H+-ATPase subunit C/Vma6
MFSPSYLTAVSQSSALSSSLLTQSQVERMVSAPSADDAFRVLYDLSWASSVSDTSDVSSFERVIDTGLYEVKKSLSKSISGSYLEKCLYFPFDLQNTKLILSSFLKGKTYEQLHDNLSYLGLFPAKEIYEVFLENDDYKGKYFFEETLLRAKRLVEETPKNLIEAQNILDAVFFKEIFKSIEGVRNPMITKILRRKIDAENIKKVLRVADDPSEKIYFLDYEKEGGYVRISKKEAEKRLEFSPMRKYLQEEKNDSLSDREVEMDLRIFGDLFWEIRSHPSGEENVLLLFFTKLRNAEIIRTILVGKCNDFSENKIRKSVSLFVPFLPTS